MYINSRDSRYVSEVEDPQVRSSLQSEGLLARERLSHLKAKLRLSNVPIRENYKDPEEFATLALKDLTTKITEDFPHDPTKDMLIQVDEQLMHEFEESTLKTFEGREEEMSALDERVLSVQTVRRPTIVVGEEGVGKSAFLVAWNRRFARKHSFDFMYTHYSGLNTESGSWAGIVRGILQVYIYIYIYIYVYTHTHTCIHVHMHTCIHAYMYTSIYAFTHACMQTNKIYACIHTHIHAYMHTYIH